ncbi:hypothetical protein V6N11_057310 [Hibiscus sabdariffa]|uniref:Uncharacterized protein n=3 Tax=Hibiscus sabdariffa TaxID=183260 RepID=A0ABR2A2G8_9ROSI
MAEVQQYPTVGWTPIKNISDPHVIEIAEFAVKENNMQLGLSLELKAVLRGTTQVVSGTNYRLLLKVTDGTSAKLYYAVVFEKAWEGSLVGRWEPIKDISDPHVHEIAEFAVDEFNKRINAITKLKLVAVVSGESQVVSGKNYRLILKAADKITTRTYQTIVWENASLKKELISFKPFLG